jgi:hypothetical protein
MGVDRVMPAKFDPKNKPHDLEDSWPMHRSVGPSKGRFESEEDDFGFYLVALIVAVGALVGMMAYACQGIPV